MIIAIDGPGGSGKTTVSRTVAERLELAHLDTGAFYRAATLAVLRAGGDLDNEAIVTLVAGLDLDFDEGVMRLGGEDISGAIRSDDVTAHVSRVSAIRYVRTLMVDHQRAWVLERGNHAVVEGRDIGTVVFPDAEVKLFLTASAEERARRRARDLQDRGMTADKNQILSQIRSRDKADSTRPIAPLRPAEDAVILDSTSLDLDAVVEHVLELVRSCDSSGSPDGSTGPTVG